MRPKHRVGGWLLVGQMSLALVLMVVAIPLAVGPGEEGVRMVIRATARTSVVLFLLAFSASSLRALVRRPATAWLLRNRRYVGVSFAVSHFLHLGALIALGVWYPDPFATDLSLITLAGGGLAYVFLAAMTLTSSDRAVAWLGLRRWKVLHKMGSYAIWFIFAQSYLPRALADPVYVPVTAAVLAAFGLRIYVHRRAAPSVAAEMT